MSVMQEMASEVEVKVEVEVEDLGRDRYRLTVDGDDFSVDGVVSVLAADSMSITMVVSGLWPHRAARVASDVLRGFEENCFEFEATQ